MDKIDYTTFKQKANSNQKIILSFGADWCRNSQKIRNQFEEISEELTNINYLNINVDENNELAFEYKVKEIPTIIILDEGKESDRIVGTTSKKKLKKTIKKGQN